METVCIAGLLYYSLSWSWPKQFPGSGCSVGFCTTLTKVCIMSIGHSGKHKGQPNSWSFYVMRWCYACPLALMWTKYNYMSAMETVCIAGLLTGILILHLMPKYEDLLMHARRNNQRILRKFDHPKCASGKYWSRIRYFQRKFIKYQAEHSKAQTWLHQSRECVQVVISGLCKKQGASLACVQCC